MEHLSVQRSHITRSIQQGSDGPFYLASTSATPSIVSTVVTFSGLSLGTVDAGRLVWACIAANREGALDPSPVSVTIAGVTATALRDIRSGNNDQYVGIFVAAVPTGVSGDVVITWSALNRTPTVACVDLYAAVGFSATPSDTVAEDYMLMPNSENLNPTTDGGVNLAIVAFDGITGPSSSLSTEFNHIVDTANDVLSGYDYPSTASIASIIMDNPQSLPNDAGAFVAAAIPLV